MNAAEEEFRAALVKYLDTMCPDPGRHLVHWMVITDSVLATDVDAEPVGLLKDEGLKFSHELGLLDYVHTMLRGRLMRADSRD